MKYQGILKGKVLLGVVLLGCILPQTSMAQEYIAKEIPSWFRLTNNPGMLSEQNTVAGYSDMGIDTTDPRVAVFDANTGDVMVRSNNTGFAAGVNGQTLVGGLLTQMGESAHYDAAIFLPDRSAHVFSLPVPLNPNAAPYGYGAVRAMAVNANGLTIVEADSGPLEGVACVSWRQNPCQHIYPVGWPNSFSYSARPAALNNLNEVVGNSNNKPYIWTPGTGDVPSNTVELPAVFDYIGPVAVSINNQSHIVGNVYGPNYSYRRFVIWDANREPSVPGAQQLGTSYQAYDNNDAGQVIGSMTQASVSSAFLYRSGRIQSLNSLVPQNVRPLDRAYALNNRGAIVACRSNATSAPTCYVLLKALKPR